MENMYTAEKFCEGLIQSIINYMTENKVEVFPLEFLANRNDYSSCEAARKFYNHGIKYFTVVNGELHVCTHSEYTHKDYDYIVSATNWPWPDNAHYSFHSQDLVILIQIAYDTIGSSYFTGRGVGSWDDDEIDELEAEYEARRNEI
jgi:hypothetical protein